MKYLKIVSIGITGLIIFGILAYYFTTSFIVNIDESYQSYTKDIGKGEIEEKEVRLIYSGKEIPLKVSFFTDNEVSYIQSINVVKQPLIAFHNISLSINSVLMSSISGQQVNIDLSDSSLFKNRIINLTVFIDKNGKLSVDKSRNIIKVNSNSEGITINI